ncbi:TSC13 [Acrasis kona]|uniref:COP9 signalosome complex subunit 3 n=1 Tax=Acrasis kona TaxID=1008807 RepID=A0AAW2YS05_9EUKA
MDQVVSLIRDTKEADLDTLKKTLESVLEKIRGNTHGVTNALGQLDPSKHSMGMVYLLYAKSQSRDVDPSFLNNVEFFLANLHGKHTQKAASRFVQVCHIYTEICRDNALYSRGIKALTTGLQRFRPSNDFLTPLHADVLCLCLKAKNYKAGFNLIENKIFDIDPNATGLTPKDMLLYFYYGGMIYIGLKHYQKALGFFETALTVPAFALNAIMVEVYKKYMLVSLLVHGKHTGLPKHAMNIVQKHMKTLCSQYYEFATVFGSGNIDNVDKVKKSFEDNEETFKSDNNLGLARQCMQALAKRNIQKLTATYMTLSLADIAKNAGLNNAAATEKVLLRMIENGEINAVIDQKGGMVSFGEEVQAFDSPQTSVILETRIDQSISLANRLKNIDEDITSSNNYIARQLGVREEAYSDFERGPSSNRGGGIRRMFEYFR